MFLPHFDVFCDLLLNRRAATWNLFVLYNKETNYHRKSFLISKSINMTRKPAFTPHSAYFDKHEEKPFDVIYYLVYKWSNLMVAMRSKRILTGPRKSRHCQTWLERRCFWNENLQRKQNWISKSTNVEENAGKWRQLLWSQQPCELKSLEVALNTAGVEKKYARKTCSYGQRWRSFNSSFEWKER